MVKKGQVSIELLLVLLFLIAFIYVYNTLAEQTVYSLELAKVKEQTSDVYLSLNEFLQFQRSVFADSNVKYTSKYKIPEINVASKKVPCKISLSDTNMVIDINSTWIFFEAFNLSLPTTIYELSSEFSCGQEITCFKHTNKIKCN
ncbi:MAG: hypothetical protein PHF68_03765 [Candidatus ainarchaeum sp.]|nr:hypothetical protein [Candidatus ainarchaeum sp.]